MEEDGGADGSQNQPSSAPGREDLCSGAPQNPDDPGEATSEPTAAVVDRREIFSALEVVERDSTAIAESFGSLFSSLRLALSEVTSTSVENMQCFSDVVGHLQESALDAATKGNRYINSCLRLNEEMKGMEILAMQLYSGLYSVCKHFVNLSYNDWYLLCDVARRKNHIKTMMRVFSPLKVLRKNVDALDLAVNRFVRLP